MAPSWPVWVVVLGAGLACQVIKTIAYGLAERRFSPVPLLQSVGLPSLPATVLSGLLVLTTMRHGWGSSETGFVLVFVVIGVHDTLKLGGAARRQREILFRIVDHLPPAEGQFARRAGAYLDPRTHHPAHMLVGALLGSLFALAFGAGPG